MNDIVDKLQKNRTLADEEFLALIECKDKNVSAYLHDAARQTAVQRFGNKIYIRGLIEFTNYCKNDCFYCGIRRSNTEAERYRLTPEQVLDCCATGYQLGFRTFVLQGGEDPGYTDEMIAEILRQIKSRFPDCAVTLSIGERSFESYLLLKKAGADRFLLRHETADEAHYRKLHPKELKLENREECLLELKELGYQVGTGFMVGSPFQTSKTLLADLRFIEKFQPQMVGIGPFVPHQCTPFAHYPHGSVEQTVNLLAMLRLMLPCALLPATTALGTVDSDGREKGILAGANVVMPNLSPVEVRKKYLLYDNKIATGEEAAESKALLEARLNKIGYEIEVGRGDYSGF